MSPSSLVKSLMVALILVVASLTAVPSASNAALSPAELLENPELEERARSLGKQLRCLVCQNQSIDDSDAELAHDLRKIVREQLVAGRTDEDIKAYMVERYGEFVLLKPPVSSATIALWAGPFAILAIAAFLLIQNRRNVQKEALPGHSPNEKPLSDAERAELDRLKKAIGGPQA